MAMEAEALVLLEHGSTQHAEEVEKAVATAGGRVLAGFLPHALLIQVPAGAVDDVRRSLGAEVVHTDAIPQAAVDAAAEPLRGVLIAWNQRRGSSGVDPEPPGRDLPWDAPGFLPPDPPAETRDLLRQRELMHGSADGDTET